MVGTVWEGGDGGRGDQSSSGLIDCFSYFFLFYTGSTVTRNEKL
jgi:hypothetical protein